jgi:hypothetical protein
LHLTSAMLKEGITFNRGRAPRDNENAALCSHRPLACPRIAGARVSL